MAENVLRESIPQQAAARLDILERGRDARYLLRLYIRDLTGSIGNIWRRWYLERGVSWRARRNADTKHRGNVSPCGWHERKQARRRGTNAKEEARFLRGESGSIRLPGQPSPRLTHPAPASHEIFCAYMSLRYYLLQIVNAKALSSQGHT